jgi:hypothetical protein
MVAVSGWLISTEGMMAGMTTIYCRKGMKRFDSD